MLENFFEVISVDDIIFAAILAFFLTILVNAVIKNSGKKSKFYRTINLGEKDFNIIFQRCCLLFPDKIINFKGNVFTRGMMVKITTVQNKIFIGKLVGQNSEKFICLLTNNFISANAIDNISEIIDLSEF